MSLLKEPLAALADQLEAKNPGRAINLFSESRDGGYGGQSDHQVTVQRDSSKTKGKSYSEYAKADVFGAK